MRVGRPVVIGWALLVTGGWAATLWLGEPSATAGPGPAPASSGVSAGNPGPGPQPENGLCPTPRAQPSPSTGDTFWQKTEVYDSTETRTRMAACYHAVFRDDATAR